MTRATAPRSSRLRAAAVASGLAVVLVLSLGTVAVVRHEGRSPSASMVVYTSGIGLLGRRGISGTVSAGSASLPAALTARTPSGSSTVVTPAMASSAFSQLWTLRNDAMAGGDRPALARIETGAALHGDDHRSLCGCLIHGAQEPLEFSSVLLPRQRQFPASFLVEVTSHTEQGKASGEYYVVTRSAASSSWKIAFVTSYVSTRPQLDAPVLDIQGYDQRASASDVARGRTAARHLAAYRMAALRTGRVPHTSEFAPGEWTTRNDAALAAFPNGRPGDAAGDRFVTTYSVGRNTPVWAFQVQGFTVACVPLTYRTTVTPGASGVVRQGLDRSPFGPEVAPGRYLRLTGRSYSQGCFYLSPNGGPVSVVGGVAGEELAMTADQPTT